MMWRTQVACSGAKNRPQESGKDCAEKRWKWWKGPVYIVAKVGLAGLFQKRRGSGVGDCEKGRNSWLELSMLSVRR